MQKLIRPKEILRQRNRRLIILTSLILLASLAYFGRWWLLNRDWVTTDDAFVTGHLIGVKAQTDGTIVEILAENTQRVIQGQVLVRLDGTKAKIELQRAQAELGETFRKIAALKAGIETLKQRGLAKQAGLNRLHHDLRRLRAAVEEGAVSEQQVQNAQDRSLQLTAEIAAIQAEKKGIEAQILGANVEKHPAVEKAKNRLRRAYLEYRRRLVIAPVTGFVAKRRAQVGELVKPGTPLLVIVPLHDLWVEANVLETKIANIRPGQPAEIKVDTYGDALVYHGRVQGINPGTGSAFALLPTDNSSGNFIHISERVPVRIGLDVEELKKNPLQPGLSTLTRINIGVNGETLLTSNVTTDSDAYRTHIYEHELDGVERLIGEIISANTVQSHRSGVAP